MADFVTSGLVADLALAVLAIEAAAILWARRRDGIRIALDVGLFLLAGAGLLVALRAALVGWPPAVILIALAVAGVAQ